MVKGSIKAVNARLEACCLDNNRDTDFKALNFSFEKFKAKFERPNSATAAKRRSDAWERWIEKDECLGSWEVLGPTWAKARLLIHEWLSDFKIGQLTFTNGSSFEPLGPRTSLACKLTDPWTVTSDCFDLFASKAYKFRAIKYAAKSRFTSYCTNNGYSERRLNRIIWREFKTPFECFKFKLYCSVTIVGGNRFSTVPKNNLKDRCICLEPSCNMLVQRAIGLGIRRALKEHCGVDLDSLADKHKELISDQNLATIDLSDCSDAISLKLIRYLLPRRVYANILASRSDMTLGPDDNYYVVNKVSSMGNGFTFDLMSLILLALTRSVDQNSSVFGDDIICVADAAGTIVNALEKADFRVNLKKTNIRTGFRESCGAYFLDGYGYITCFDLKWVKTNHDLVVCLNKVAILAKVYGEPFDSLNKGIRSCVPPVLLGASTDRLVMTTSKPPSFDLSNYVRYGRPVMVQPSPHQLKVIRRICKPLHITGPISVGSYEYEATNRGKIHLKSSDWDMFFQNISSSRVQRRIQTSRTKSSLIARVGEDLIGPLDALFTSNGV